jgi:pilus assembly protein Flp/PilA
VEVAQPLPPYHSSFAVVRTRAPHWHTRPCASGDALEGDVEFINHFRSLVRDEEGQDLLEYALLIALIALVCVGAVALAGTSVSQVFTNIAGQIPAGI